LVIVPTVALALDQERAFRDLLRATDRRLPTENFAYYGELDEPERAAMRARIRSGEQTIIFTAPESVERSLAFSLYEAAEFGLIKAFVIDEAHVVSEWGDEFRPEFQSVAGLRRGLLRAAERSQTGPFRTLLLTATPTQDALETLAVCFSDPQRPLGIVGAPELRLEPAYWTHEFSDEATRESAVLEAVRHLPRPLLLYATTVKDSSRWANLLRAAGYRRVALVNGTTPAAERRGILAGWRGVVVDGRSTRRTRFDIVVATSAFGLGVDQEDVRAVIHACIPETVDRFYQEVGRGGRDGRASLSLVLHTAHDEPIAKHINQTKLISRELAEARLGAMLGTAVPLGDDRWQVDLASLPPHTNHKRSYNLQWNQRTINLLARAGAVAWDGEKPELTDAAEDDRADPEAWGAVLRLLRADHRSDAFWTQVESTRARRLKADATSLGRMREALAAGADIHRLLRNAYEVSPDSDTRLAPAESCGGCPWCRRHHYPWLVGGSVLVSNVASDAIATGRLAWLTKHRDAAILCYRSSDLSWSSKVSDAIRSAVAMGAIALILHESAAGIDLTRVDQASPRSAVFIERPESIDLRYLPDVPAVFVAGPTATECVTHDLVAGSHLMPTRRLLIVGDATRDPSRSDRLLTDIRQWESIDVFLEAR
jgi:superfamily II DNA/RNA helicase